MSETKPRNPNPASDERTETEDVEGHNLWIGPTVGRDLARNHSRELERKARDRQRTNDAKTR
jgi:hypothetical protein